MEGELQQLVGVLDCVQKKNEEQVLVSMRAGATVPFPNGRSTRLAKSTERARGKEQKAGVSVYLDHLKKNHERCSSKNKNTERKICKGSK